MRSKNSTDTEPSNLTTRMVGSLWPHDGRAAAYPDPDKAGTGDPTNYTGKRADQPNRCAYAHEQASTSSGASTPRPRTPPPTASLALRVGCSSTTHSLSKCIAIGDLAAPSTPVRPRATRPSATAAASGQWPDARRHTALLSRPTRSSAAE
jgi:hypothetical protein